MLDKFGLQEEEKVISYLASLGLDVRPSSQEENMRQDIDVWVNGVPVSIKAQLKCKSTGNLVFELQLENRKTGVWVDSWYNRGKALVYLMLVGDNLYYIDKNLLVDYVSRNGFSMRSLMKTTLKAQYSSSRVYCAARLGLLSLNSLINEGVAVLFHTFREEVHCEEVR